MTKDGTIAKIRDIASRIRERNALNLSHNKAPADDTLPIPAFRILGTKSISRDPPPLFHSLLLDERAVECSAKTKSGIELQEEGWRGEWDDAEET